MSSWSLVEIVAISSYFHCIILASTDLVHSYDRYGIINIIYNFSK